MPVTLHPGFYPPVVASRTALPVQQAPVAERSSLRFGTEQSPQTRRLSRPVLALVSALLGLQGVQFLQQHSVNQSTTQSVQQLRGKLDALTTENRELRSALQAEQAKTTALEKALPTAALDFIEQVARDRALASLTFRVYNLEKQEGVSTASGGVIQAGNRTFILTNAHVLEDLPALNKEAPHGVFLAPFTNGEKTTMYRANIVQVSAKPGDTPKDAVSPARDTALLEIVPEQVAEFNSKVKPAPLYPLDKPLPYGGLIYLYGAPFKQRDSVTLGVLASPAVKQQNDYALPVIYTDAKSNHGSSGGLAIYAKTGEVLGIQVMINNNDTAMTYLIPIRHIKGWLEYECGQPCMTDAEKKAYPIEAYREDQQAFADWQEARRVFDAERAKEAKSQQAEEAKQAEAQEVFIKAVRQALVDLKTLRQDVDALKQGKK